MDDSYANGEGSVSFATQDEMPDETVVIGNPEPEICSSDKRNINIFASSINATEYTVMANGIASFDVVFSVNITDEVGNTKTYQVVKRIGVDKCKMAAEAESGTPVSIVETKKVVEQKPVLTEAQRFKRLAGLE